METPADDPAVKFKRLFWKARREHARLDEKATGRESGHRTALAFAREYGLPVEGLLQASLLDRQGKDAEALQLLDETVPRLPAVLKGAELIVRSSVLLGLKQVPQTIATCHRALAEPSLDRRAYAWNYIGLAHSETDHYDESIEAHQRALDEADNDQRGLAWTCIGMAHHAKKAYDQAIAAFRRALEEADCDEPWKVWDSLGIAYLDKGDYVSAIQAIRKALEEPGYDRRGVAWHNLGVTFHNKRDYREAIAAYLQALNEPGYLGQASTWTNLGSLYQLTGSPGKAVDAYEAALKAPDTDGLDHARAGRMLSLLKAAVGTEALSKDDRALLKAAPAVDKEDDNEIEKRIAARIINKETQYKEYFDRYKPTRDNVLSILRGWSSSVTLLEGTRGSWRGGGYFLKWRGHGIVIDPGFDFLRNFHDDHYHGREIDAVLVSHNHPDHNSDLKPLDDLRYELQIHQKTGTDREMLPYVLICDRDTARNVVFASERGTQRVGPMDYNTGVADGIDLRHSKRGLPFKVNGFDVDHGRDVQNAVGFVVTLFDEHDQPALRIGYTGDTIYSPALAKNLQGCDVLIVHISQPRGDDLVHKVNKGNHLGYWGTVQVLKEARPRLALIGEFWAGIADLRIDLVKGLRHRSGLEAVFPTGLGMHLELPSLKIICSQCKKPASFDEVRVAPPMTVFGNLAYLCSSCLLDKAL